MAFTPSKYQSAIFDFVKNGKGNAVIEAVAGSGKSTVITHAVKMIDTTKSVLILAFNKVIADSMCQKVNQSNVEAKTFHSLGFAAYKACHGSKVKMDNSKLFKIIDDLVYNSDLTEAERAGVTHIAKIVRLAKSHGIGTSLLADSIENWAELIEYHDVGGFDDEADFSAIIPVCREVLRRSNNMTNIIDFDDMIYLPVQQNLSFRKYDWVFVDETQDCSNTQRVILQGLMKSTSRFIAVGDRKQSLYGFRGADSNAMTGIEKSFNCSLLPLSISYRCAKSIIAEAQKFVPYIEASPTAIEGSVTELDKYSASDFTNTDAIICRNVAPLLSMAYGLISRGVPVNMRGRDIGKGITSLIKNLRAKNIAELDVKLLEWSTKETMRLSTKQGNESKVDSVNDKFECVSIFIQQATPEMTVSDLISRIESFFSDEPNGNIVLSSIHRAKGLEWKRTFILDKSRFMPKWIKREWQKEQEKNVIYVAVTRGIEDLIYISSGCWKD